MGFVFGGKPKRMWFWVWRRASLLDPFTDGHIPHFVRDDRLGLG